MKTLDLAKVLTFAVRRVNGGARGTLTAADIARLPANARAQIEKQIGQPVESFFDRTKRDDQAPKSKKAAGAKSGRGRKLPLADRIGKWVLSTKIRRMLNPDGRLDNFFGIDRKSRRKRRARRQAKHQLKADKNLAIARYHSAVARNLNSGKLQPGQTWWMVQSKTDDSAWKPDSEFAKEKDAERHAEALRLSGRKAAISKLVVTAKKTVRATKPRLWNSNGKGSTRTANMHPLEILSHAGIIGTSAIALHDRFKKKGARKGNLGLIDAAASLQAAEFLEKELGGGKKRRRNTPSTDDLYREFQGRDPQGKVTEVLTLAGTPKNVSELGPLIDIELERFNEPLTFVPAHKHVNGDPRCCDRAALKNPQAFLSQARIGNMRRLYVGHLKALNVEGRNGNGGRAINLGRANAISYWAQKDHLTNGNGKPKMEPYRHPCGDRGGKKPDIYLVPIGDGRYLVDIRGGDYTVGPWGIDN